MIGSALMNNQQHPMAQMGRRGDNLLAHLSVSEAELLRQLGGAGTTNPKTGALEFWPSGGPGDVGGATSGSSDTDGDGSDENAGHNESDAEGEMAGAESPTGRSGAEAAAADQANAQASENDPDGFGTDAGDVGGIAEMAANAMGVNGFAGTGYGFGALGTTVGAITAIGDFIGEMAARAGLSVDEPTGIRGGDPNNFGGGDGPPGNDGPGDGDNREGQKGGNKIATSVGKAAGKTTGPSWGSTITAGLWGNTPNTGGLPRADGQGAAPKNFSAGLLKGEAKDMATKGRDGDTLLAHINPGEAKLLKALGGRGSINPETGALEFANENNFDVNFYREQNQDLGDVSDDELRGHYFKWGKDEGRVANSGEQTARSEGYTGLFGKPDSGTSYVDWKQGKQQELAGFQGADGNINRDLTGGNLDLSNIGGAVDQLTSRQEARDRGYAGEFGQGGYSKFMENYYDHDNDASTKWVTDNDSNMDRAGNDATVERQKLRDLGFSGLFGDGGAGAFLQQKGQEYGLTGDLTPEKILAAKQAQEDEQNEQQSWQDMMQAFQTRMEDLYGNAAAAAPPPQTAQPAANIMPQLPYRAINQARPTGVPSLPGRGRMRVNPWTGAIEYEPVNTFSMANAGAATQSAGVDPRRRGFGSLVML